MKPKTLASAFDSGYIVKKVYDRGGDKIRVDVKPRFGAGICSFWINRKYFERTYKRLASYWLLQEMY